MTLEVTRSLCECFRSSWSSSSCWRALGKRRHLLDIDGEVGRGPWKLGNELQRRFEELWSIRRAPGRFEELHGSRARWGGGQGGRGEQSGQFRRGRGSSGGVGGTPGRSEELRGGRGAPVRTGELWGSQGSSGEVRGARGSSGELRGARGSSVEIGGAPENSEKLGGAPGSTGELG